jgi:uncharacterized protein YyaL (SSP411 family)
MISALAKAHQVLGTGAGEPAYLTAAVRAAEFLRRELYDEARGVLHRSWLDGRGETEGFAEDYACVVQGLLDLYEASFEVRWLEWAVRLQETMDAQFWDERAGGYFNSRADDAALVLRLKEDYDGAEPAPSSLAALNLLRLEAMLGDGAATPSSPADAAGAPRPQVYGARALQTIEALRPQWSKVPQALPQLLCAIELALEPPRHVVLAGDPAAADFRALAAVLHERLGPRRAILCAEGPCDKLRAGGAGQAWLAERAPWIGAMQPVGGRATAYVCERFTCQAPVTDPAALRRLLGTDK